MTEPKDLSKIHPMRRKRHRRGKRGGVRARERLANVPVVVIPPEVVKASVSSLRHRLAQFKPKET